MVIVMVPMWVRCAHFFTSVLPCALKLKWRRWSWVWTIESLPPPLKRKKKKSETEEIKYYKIIFLPKMKVKMKYVNGKNTREGERE